MPAISFVRATKNQSLVFQYLLSFADASRRVKISSGKVARHFGWTQQYAQKILQRLEDKDVIELILRGEGRRPNKYKIAKIKMVVATENNKKQVPEPVVTTSNQKKTKTVVATEKNKKDRKSISEPVATTSNKKVHLLCNNFITEKKKDNIYIRTDNVRIDNAHTDNVRANARAHTRIEDLDDHIPSQTARVKDKSRLTILGTVGKSSSFPSVSVTKRATGPFLRFQKKKDAPEKWNAVDILCYYAYLWRRVYGSIPAIDWKVETGAARNLLSHFGDDPKKVKKYLKIAFEVLPEKFRPSGLNALTQSWVINEAKAQWDTADTFYYRDSAVFA